MSRIFAYVRVSTFEQTTDNQINEIKSAGFNIEPHRIISETISGSVPTKQRKQFNRLIDRLEKGDVLIVTKLDRLGRDAIDVSNTVNNLAEANIRVHCLALGGVDLNSSAGKLTMGVINSVAQFEKDLLVERTQSGLQRAREQGKRLGRPYSLSEHEILSVKKLLNNGETCSSIARKFNTSRFTIMRIRDKNKQVFF